MSEGNVQSNSESSWQRKQPKKQPKKPPAAAAGGDSSSTERMISFLRERTDEVILMYSGGKDSLCLLDKLAARFRRVVCVYMYLVKDLDHMRPYMEWPKRRYNCEVIQIPHWQVSKYYAEGYLRIDKASPDIKKLKLKDIYNHVRVKTGIDWVVIGSKRSDSMVRHFYLGSLHLGGISLKERTANPLADWTNKEVLAYLKHNHILSPLVYAEGKRSQGVDLTRAFLKWCKVNAPQDYRRILIEYPLADHVTQ